MRWHLHVARRVETATEETKKRIRCIHTINASFVLSLDVVGFSCDGHEWYSSRLFLRVAGCWTRRTETVEDYKRIGWLVEGFWWCVQRCLALRLIACVYTCSMYVYLWNNRAHAGVGWCLLISVVRCSHIFPPLLCGNLFLPANRCWLQNYDCSFAKTCIVIVIVWLLCEHTYTMRTSFKRRFNIRTCGRYCSQCVATLQHHRASMREHIQYRRSELMKGKNKH